MLNGFNILSRSFFQETYSNKYIVVMTKEHELNQSKSKLILQMTQLILDGYLISFILFINMMIHDMHCKINQTTCFQLHVY